MDTPARPTLRCLHEDLTSDWDDVADHRLVQDRQAGLRKRVHDLQHALVRKAVEDFPPDLDVVKHRQSISGLTNPPYWKVRVERWRGAVYVDNNDQPWLVAGGLRYGGEGKDFYARFMALVKAHGAEYFLPTEEDKFLLRSELAEGDFVAWERYLASAARDWVCHARQTRDLVTGVVKMPAGEDLFHVTVMYVPANEDTPHEFIVELIPKDWSLHRMIEWAEQVLLAAIHACESRWGHTFTNARMHSIEIDTLDELDAVCSGQHAAQRPGYMDPGFSAHVVHSVRLTENIISGDPVRGICGQWFVPRQDHENKPQCAQCRMLEEVFGLQNGPSKP